MRNRARRVEVNVEELVLDGVPTATENDVVRSIEAAIPALVAPRRAGGPPPTAGGLERAIRGELSRHLAEADGR